MSENIMKMYQVDAFTQTLFKGNPAAVLILDEWLSDELMQSIALENNLAETAFVKKIDQSNYEIRWFTPLLEVDFCGHATLASAFVIFKDYTSLKTIRFHVKNLGVFIIEQSQEGKIKMNFPIRAAQPVFTYPTLLNQVIDQPIQAVYKNEQAFILILESAEAVRKAKPNYDAIQQLAKTYQISTAITAREDLEPDITITARSDEYDYVARYFAPHKGIDEDPVTGSMHTGLAPLWAGKLAKNTLTAYQASSRGGVLYCQILNEDRIEISGYATLYLIADVYI